VDTPLIVREVADRGAEQAWVQTAPGRSGQSVIIRSVSPTRHSGSTRTANNAQLLRFIPLEVESAVE
jgi:hypothetical protein